jgi:hypothetical protein
MNLLVSISNLPIHTINRTYANTHTQTTGQHVPCSVHIETHAAADPWRGAARTWLTLFDCKNKYARYVCVCTTCYISLCMHAGLTRSVLPLHLLKYRIKMWHAHTHAHTHNLLRRTFRPILGLLPPLNKVGAASQPHNGALGVVWKTKSYRAVLHLRPSVW